MDILNMDNKHLRSKLIEITKDNLSCDIIDFSFIGGGSNGKVFKATLNDRGVVAVKAFRTQGSQFTEAEQLRVLKDNTSVSMPEIIFTHADSSTAVMCMSFIEGVNALNPFLLLKNKNCKNKFALDVIKGMSEWHSVKREKFGELKSPKYDSWIDYYRSEKQEKWLKGLTELSKKGKFSNKKLSLLLRATEIYNSVYEEPENAVLIHGDLNIMNIMVDLKNLKLNGFIDPCGSIWADREYDLFQLQNMWGNSFGLYETYKSMHKMSEHTDFRVAYYGAMNEASCRLGSGLIFPLWEDLWNIRLKKAMEKYV